MSFSDSHGTQSSIVHTYTKPITAISIQYCSSLSYSDRCQKSKGISWLEWYWSQSGWSCTIRFDDVTSCRHRLRPEHHSVMSHSGCKYAYVSNVLTYIRVSWSLTAPLIAASVKSNEPWNPSDARFAGWPLRVSFLMKAHDPSRDILAIHRHRFRGWIVLSLFLSGVYNRRV